MTETPLYDAVVEETGIEPGDVPATITAQDLLARHPRPSDRVGPVDRWVIPVDQG